MVAEHVDRAPQLLAEQPVTCSVNFDFVFPAEQHELLQASNGITSLTGPF